MNLYIDPGNVPSFLSKILCSIFSCPKADYWEGTLNIEPECPCSLQKRRKTCTASSFLVYRVESKIRWEMSSTEKTVVFYRDLRNTLAKPFSWVLELGLCPELLQPGEGGHALPIVLLAGSGVKGVGLFPFDWVYSSSLGERDAVRSLYAYLWLCHLLSVHLWACTKYFVLWLPILQGSESND